MTGLGKSKRRAHIGLLMGACLSAAACSNPAGVTPPPTPVDPPKITCPASQSLVSPLGDAIPVVYTAPTVVGGKAPVTTSCTPSSGSMFPIGSGTVVCTAVDAQQRADSCLFTITVTRPPQISLTRFSAFGDSMTWGEDGTNPTNLLGSGTIHPEVQLVNQEYWYVLEQELKARYTAQFSQIRVNNDGQRGEAAGASATLTRFSGVLSSGWQAVLIMEGANDLGLYGAAGEAAAISNLRAMIESAKRVGVRPYLATIPPENPNAPCIPACRGSAAGLVPGFNDLVRGVASLEGITLVDVFQAFGGDLTLLSTDGLHPNARGYQRIADTFFTALRGTLELPPTILPAPTPSTVRQQQRGR
jgi:lysophospholipase L1-like esterase